MDFLTTTTLIQGSIFLIGFIIIYNILAIVQSLSNKVSHLESQIQDCFCQNNGMQIHELPEEYEAQAQAQATELQQEPTPVQTQAVPEEPKPKKTKKSKKSEVPAISVTPPSGHLDEPELPVIYEVS